MSRAASRVVLGSAALATALSLTACASTESSTAPAADSMDEPDDGRVEVDAPQPRLVVATDVGVVVLDPADGTVLDSFETATQPAPVVAGDGRHVFLVQREADRTQVLDAGTWAAEHGDHAHYYVADPALRDVEVQGVEPVHVVSHDGRTAIFHDGDGTATLFRDAGLRIDSLDEAVLDTGAPHHGVVVPLAAGAVVSIPPPTGDDTLPTGVTVVDEDGAEVVRFDDCPGLHGEAAVGNMLAFACSDGVLLVEGEHAHKVDYPGGDGRVGSFTAGPVGDYLVGNYTATSLLALHVETATAHEITVDLPYAARVYDEHGE
ncbi:MAG TPA: hypothetical protein VK925_12550, partial [Jiangellaceae bacterium]|nr:hypothetical protein [Jiangellaceae bacterium]